MRSDAGIDRNLLYDTESGRNRDRERSDSAPVRVAGSFTTIQSSTVSSESIPFSGEASSDHLSQEWIIAIPDPEDVSVKIVVVVGVIIGFIGFC